jgi:hypothetical protein
MPENQLKRAYALVGEITTEFNIIELGWYLILTGLMSPTPRAIVDAVFDQFKTGGAQRKLIVEVAAAANPPLEIKERIGNLYGKTGELAGRRNHVIHAIIFLADFIIPPRVGVTGIGKPSKLTSKEIESELKTLLADIEYHSLDVEALRLDVIAWVHPQMNIERERHNLERVRQVVATKHPRTP